MDFRQFVNLESYLFKVVGPTYRKTGKLSTFDFFCIVIWKANRSKSKIAKKLLKKRYHTLDEAIKVLSRNLWQKSTSEDKMQYLFKKWGFRLPMASAILTVLYPKDFTVYDIRVCGMLKNFNQLAHKTGFENLWPLYEDFKRAFKKATPSKLSLREKDRYLWGKSFYNQLKKDLKNNFK